MDWDITSKAYLEKRTDAADASLLFFKLALQIFCFLRAKHALNVCASKLSTSTDSVICFLSTYQYEIMNMMNIE